MCPAAAEPARPLPEPTLRTLALTLMSDGDDEYERFALSSPPSRLYAGYTYLGQLIAHDLSSDRAKFQPVQNAAASLNERSPRFDLECIYGFGPAKSPDLYDADGAKLRLASGGHDFVRPPDAQGIVVFDHRNDFHQIISQLHAGLARFHNKVVDSLRGGQTAHDAGASEFETARRIVCWHYQWIIAHEYLPSILQEDVLDDVWQRVRNTVHRDALPARLANLLLFRPGAQLQLPVELVGAVFRFGHSMVRTDYLLNDHAGAPIPLIDHAAGDVEWAADLRGGRPLPDKHIIDWDYFFPRLHTDPAPARKKLQLARRINRNVSGQLAVLPRLMAEATDADSRCLRFRDLYRGENMQALPSGQEIAAYLEHAHGLGGLDTNAQGEPLRFDIPQIAFIHSAIGQYGVSRESLVGSLSSRTPLWYYTLREAEHFHRGLRLGPVASRVMAETFIGILVGSGDGYLAAQPGWLPQAERFGCVESGKFCMRDLLGYAAASI